MKKEFITAVLFVAFNTAFAQQNCDKLKLENKQLQAQVDSLESQLSKVLLLAVMSNDESAEALLMLMAFEKASSIDNDEQSDTNEPAETSFVTEEEALGYIEDHYDFYNRNYVYKNVKLRRVADNEFKVSLEERNRNYSSWDAVVKTLIVGSDGKYRFSRY